MIPIYKPYLNKYKKSSINALDSEWISNYGEYIQKSEDKLKQIFNKKVKKKTYLLLFFKNILF